MLTAVVDGTLGFAAVASEGSTAAIARGAVTENWLGISAVRVAENQRRRGLAAQVCDILLGWGAALGARRAYVRCVRTTLPPWRCTRLWVSPSNTAIGMRRSALPGTKSKVASCDWPLGM